MSTMTHEEFRAECVSRFGPDVADWAFICPNCHDVATGADLRTALEAKPRQRGNGTPVLWYQVLGQECIGRQLGALEAGEAWDRARERGEVRGCQWVSYGLLRGPLLIEIGDSQIGSFQFAEATSQQVPA